MHLYFNLSSVQMFKWTGLGPNFQSCGLPPHGVNSCRELFSMLNAGIQKMRLHHWNQYVQSGSDTWSDNPTACKQSPPSKHKHTQLLAPETDSEHTQTPVILLHSKEWKESLTRKWRYKI